MSSIPKNMRSECEAALKMNIFLENLFNTFFLLQEQSPNIKYEIDSF